MIDLIKDSALCKKYMMMFFAAALVITGIAWALGGYHTNAEGILEMPGGMAAFAFLGCWVLIILAKLIMTPLLQRDEDYYQKGDDEDA